MANRRRGGIVSMTVLMSVALGASEGIVEAQFPDPNLIVNGGFEEPVVDGLGSFSSNPGWNVVPGSPEFEIQRGIAGSPFEGAQHCELDGFSPTAIFQDVPTTPGRVYRLSFAFSPRPGLPLADNVLRVFWGGNEGDRDRLGPAKAGTSTPGPRIPDPESPSAIRTDTSPRTA